MNSVPPGTRLALTSFKNTDRGPQLATWDRGPNAHSGPVAPVSRQLAVADVGTGPPPLLSSTYKNDRGWRLPAISPFSPIAEVSYHCPPAADWLHHWAIPRAQLIYTSLCSFCPRFQHCRPIPLSSNADHAGDLCPPPVRAFPTASWCRQGPPS
jgi:hypothetical protein